VRKQTVIRRIFGIAEREGLPSAHLSYTKTCGRYIVGLGILTNKAIIVISIT